MTIELTIIGPSTKMVIDVAWIDIETTQGSMIILPAHEPLLTELKAHSHMTYAQKNVDGSLFETSMQIASAIIDVTRSSVTVILDEYT